LDAFDRTEALCCEVLAFIVDVKQPWQGEYREAYRLTKAMNVGSATPELFAENTCTLRSGARFLGINHAKQE